MYCRGLPSNGFLIDTCAQTHMRERPHAHAVALLDRDVYLRRASGVQSPTYSDASVNVQQLPSVFSVLACMCVSVLKLCCA